MVFNTMQCAFCAPDAIQALAPPKTFTNLPTPDKESFRKTPKAVKRRRTALNGAKRGSARTPNYYGANTTHQRISKD